MSLVCGAVLELKSLGQVRVDAYYGKLMTDAKPEAHTW